MPKGIRPTQDVHRKAIFDVLQGVIVGAKFLDLFAGSGAVGVEALSRRAKEVVLVERDGNCAAMIRKNLEELEKGAKTHKARYRVLALDVFLAIPLFHRSQEKFDIIFIDPSYYNSLKSKSLHQPIFWAKKTLQTLTSYDILSPNGLVVCQHSSKEILPESIEFLTLFKQKKDGSTVISFYRRH